MLYISVGKITKVFWKQYINQCIIENYCGREGNGWYFIKNCVYRNCDWFVLYGIKTECVVWFGMLLYCEPDRDGI